MKCLKCLFIVIIGVTSLSLITERTSRLSDSINPGTFFPDIKNIENISGKTANLSDFKGQKVLVNFWAAYDSNSRRDNILFSKLTEQENSSLRMVSVSFDKSKSVFEKTVTMDGIDKNCQYYVSADSHPELVELYKPGGSFKNFLIDEEGVILAVDLSPEELESMYFE